MTNVTNVAEDFKLSISDLINMLLNSEDYNEVENNILDIGLNVVKREDTVLDEPPFTIIDAYIEDGEPVIVVG